MRSLALALAFVNCLPAADPALTIYNQDFAVIRETVPLDLRKGENRVTVSNVTSGLEPDSVILRDSAGRVSLRIVEQNYRADPVSTESLLARFEGQTIQFLVAHPDRTDTIEGKVIRAPSTTEDPNSGGAIQQSPIIEIGGKLRFSLPGEPLFPALGTDTILKPALNWIISSDEDARLNAELAYVSHGLSWSADYNIVSAAGRPDVDLIGWVTMANKTGKEFENARIKLMAGDVNKINPVRMLKRAKISRDTVYQAEPQVTEQAFDEYHLYTLEHPATIHDKETKQVEFIRAEHVDSKQIFIYDGLNLDRSQYTDVDYEQIRNNPAFGLEGNTKVQIVRELKNSTANHLGIPLPAGRMRFYRQDTDGQLEFTGEAQIPHTPKNETVRVNTGSAFDLTGERKRADYRVDVRRRQADESFEIKLRNHKTEAVEIRVIEHLYRGATWEITEHSAPFTKTDAQTVEFRIPLKPDEERTLTYDAHYTW